MITIEYMKNGQLTTKKVQDWIIEETLASFRRAGYTIISDGSTPAPVIETPKVEAETTGRVGKGHEVHRLISGSAKCGTSFRKGFGTNLPTYVTGEKVTCSKCH